MCSNMNNNQFNSYNNNEDSNCESVFRDAGYPGDTESTDCSLSEEDEEEIHLCEDCKTELNEIKNSNSFESNESFCNGQNNQTDNLLNITNSTCLESRDSSEDTPRFVLKICQKCKKPKDPRKSNTSERVNYFDFKSPIELNENKKECKEQDDDKKLNRKKKLGCPCKSKNRSMSRESARVHFDLDKSPQKRGIDLKKKSCFSKNDYEYKDISCSPMRETTKVIKCECTQKEISSNNSKNVNNSCNRSCQTSNQSLPSRKSSSCKKEPVRTCRSCQTNMENTNDPKSKSNKFCEASSSDSCDEQFECDQSCPLCNDAKTDAPCSAQKCHNYTGRKEIPETEKKRLHKPPTCSESLNNFENKNNSCDCNNCKKNTQNLKCTCIINTEKDCKLRNNENAFLSPNTPACGCQPETPCCKQNPNDSEKSKVQTLELHVDLGKPQKNVEWAEQNQSDKNTKRNKCSSKHSTKSNKCRKDNARISEKKFEKEFRKLTSDKKNNCNGKNLQDDKKQNATVNNCRRCDKAHFCDPSGATVILDAHTISKLTNLVNRHYPDNMKK